MFQQHQILPICTNSVDVKSLFQSKAQVFSFLEKLQSLVLNLLLMPGEGLTHQNTFSFNHTGPTMGCILEKSILLIPKILSPVCNLQSSEFQ